MDIRRFHRQLFDAARALIPPQTGVLCAVSGGADSMAMLHALACVNEMHNCRWRLSIGHVDHSLRPDSSEDARFVVRVAEQLKLPHAVERRDVAAEANMRRESLETAARNVRYAVMREMGERLGANFVAVAHHADDQAETVLHRVCRGTGLAGLAGMANVRRLSPDSEIRLIRPMLGFRREELRDYIALRGLAYRHDATNDLPNATRNRVRNDVLPLIQQKLNPNVTLALNRLAENARQANEALDELASRAMEGAMLASDPNQVAISVGLILAEPEAVRARMVLLALRQLGVSLQTIGQSQIDLMLALTIGDGHRRTIELPGDISACRQGMALIISRAPTHRAPRHAVGPLLNGAAD